MRRARTGTSVLAPPSRCAGLEARSRSARSALGERRQDGLGRRVHRAPGPIVAAPGGPGRSQRLHGAGRFQNDRHLADFLGVDPAHHIGHASGGHAPRRRAAGPAAWLRWRTRTPRRPWCPRPWPSAPGRWPSGASCHVPAAVAQRRPVARSGTGGPGGVDAPHLAHVSIGVPGCAEQVALHAGRHHRPVPAQDGRHGQRGRLAALGRADHHHRLRRLGHHPRWLQPAPAVVPSEQAARVGCVQRQQDGPQLVPVSPMGAATIALRRRPSCRRS